MRSERVFTIGPMACRVFGDRDVRRLSAAVAVEAMRDALRAAHEGRLSAPPRVRSELNDVACTFTVGAIADAFSGFRAYRVGEPAGDQLVAAWDAQVRAARDDFAPKALDGGKVVAQEARVARAVIAGESRGVTDKSGSLVSDGSTMPGPVDTASADSSLWLAAN